MKKWLLIISLFFLSGCALVQDKVFTNVRTESQVTKNTFPFNQEKATIKKVAFDILYGNGRDYVGYKGEVPYLNTRRPDGTALSGFSSEPFLRTSPSITNEDYWGKTDIKLSEDEALEKEKAVSKTELEKVNTNDIKSLRLFGWIIYISDLSGALYNLVSNIVKLILYGLNLIVMVKSIDVTMILEVMNIDGLNQAIVDLFVIQRDVSGGLKASPFFVFAILSLIISITMFILKYLKGDDAYKGLSGLFKDILGVALLGFLLLGLGMSGRVTTVGNAFSNVLNQVLYFSNPLQTEQSIFVTEVNGDVDLNSLYYHQQISGINRVYIDAQIINQFNVESVSELAFSEFTKNPQIIKDLIEDPSKVEHNLGYYFWWANSPAKDLDNTQIPTITSTQQQKLSKMITFLQQSYNEATEKGDKIKQEKIKNIMTAFAQRHAFGAFIRMLLLSAVFVMLAVVLFMYGVKSALGKVLLLFSLLGIPIAALLIISANEKLVKTGKSILGLALISFLQIVVFDTFFNLIIYMMLLILTNNIVVYVLSAIGLFLFMKLNPFIHNYLNKILNTVKQMVTPSLVESERTLRTYVSNQNRLFGERLRSQEKKVVGYDENGNPIQKHGKINQALQFLSSAVGNQLDTNVGNRKSLRRIFKQEKIKNEKEDAFKGNQVEKAEENIRKSKISSIENLFKEKANEKSNVAITKDENGNTTFNTDYLNASEKELHSNLNGMKDSLASLKQDENYNRLMEKQKTSKLSYNEHTYLNEHNKKINELDKQIKNKTNELSNKITTRTKEDVLSESNEDVQSLKQLYDEKLEKANEMLLDKKRKSLLTAGEVVDYFVTEKKKSALEKGVIPTDINLSPKDRAEIEKLVAEQRTTKIKKGDKSNAEKNKALLDSLREYFKNSNQNIKPVGEYKESSTNSSNNSSSNTNKEDGTKTKVTLNLSLEDKIPLKRKGGKKNES